MSVKRQQDRAEQARRAGLVGTRHRLGRGVKPRGQAGCGCSGQPGQEERGLRRSLHIAWCPAHGWLGIYVCLSGKEVTGDRTPEKQTWPSFTLEEDRQLREAGVGGARGKGLAVKRFRRL